MPQDQTSILQDASPRRMTDSLCLQSNPSGPMCPAFYYLVGYNPLGFDGFGSDKATMGAFLFTWPDGDTKVRDTLIVGMRG